MLSGQPIFIIGILSIIAGYVFTFKHHSELFWFGVISVIVGITLFTLSAIFCEDDDENESECNCDMCKKLKYDPNDYK